MKNPSKTAISSPVTGSLCTSHPTSHYSISLKYLLKENYTMASPPAMAYSALASLPAMASPAPASPPAKAFPALASTPLLPLLTELSTPIPVTHSSPSLPLSPSSVTDSWRWRPSPSWRWRPRHPQSVATILLIRIEYLK